MFQNGCFRVRDKVGVRENWFFVLTWLSNSWKAYCPGTPLFRTYDLPNAGAETDLDKWGEIADIPSGMENLSSFGTAVIGHKLYVIGGRANMLDTLTGEVFDTTSKKDVWVYDVSKNEWSSGPQMNVSRSSFACAVVGGKIYAAGGRDDTGRCLACAEVFDTELGEWRMLPSMDSMRYFCYGFSLRGKFFVYQQRMSGVEMYDPLTNSWSKDDKLKIPGQSVVLAGRLYSVNGSGEIKVHDPFDATRADGETVQSLSEESSYCYGRAVAAIDGRLAIFGGTTYDGSGRVHNEILFWDPLANQWGNSASLDLADATVVGFAVVDV